MGDLSAHFSSDEFRCKGDGVDGHRPHRLQVHTHLVFHLEVLRELAGGAPLRIVSGHRCAWWNEQVGGAVDSQHVKGTAADIPVGYATVTEAETAGFAGVGGTEAWAIHVDVRPDQARWEY